MSITQHKIPLTLAILAVILAAAGSDFSQALRYERDAVLEGQWWRLITGNLVHLGFNHMLMNLAGLLLIWLLFYRCLTQVTWLVVTCTSALGVGLGLVFFNPELDWYVGLSGALHGLFVAGIVASIANGHHWDWVLLALFTTKILWEQVHGALPGSAQMAGGAVIVDAHFYGAVSGLLVVLIVLFPLRKRGIVPKPRQTGISDKLRE